MHLDRTFSVVAPIDAVWETLMDFERVAGCVPGAQVLAKLSDDKYQVGMKVKLGPVTMQYKGRLDVIERDVAGHRAVLEGSAQEIRGQGTAQATVTLLLTESEGQTQGTVSAELSLSGKAAAMGKSVIGSVTDQMLALFTGNLQTMVGTPTSEPPAAVSSTGGLQAATAPPETTPPPPPAAGPSLDALALAKGLITDLLSSPGKLVGLLAVVAFVAYRLGRRAATARSAVEYVREVRGKCVTS